MGDVSQSSQSPDEYPAHESGTKHKGHGIVDGQPAMPSPGQASAHNQPYPVQYAQSYGMSQQVYSNQYDMAQAHGAGRQGPFNMSAIAGALPQTARPNYPQAGQQRFSHGAVSPTVVHQMAQMPQMSQYPPGPTMSPLSAQQYYMSQQPQMQAYYNGPLSPSQHHANVPPRGNMGYYQGQVVVNHAQYQPSMAANQYYSQPNQFHEQPQTMQGPMSAGQYLVPQMGHGGRFSSQSDEGGRLSSEGRSNESPSSRSNVVRGPPRKPRQSGHAIWVGNLPPQTDLMSLVHHVCKEAVGLESLFLISKSNCAFANFKDEQTCVAAQQKLHDSKFQSVRLVSRLRKSTVEGAAGVTAPTGPSASASNVQQPMSDGLQSPGRPDSDKGSTAGQSEVTNPPTADTMPQKDKFFVLKSLTIEDLELSVRTGIWATQAHNEEALNKAFQAVDNVYLVFSANKSGEYFGYARMISPINEDPAAAIEFAPQVQSTDDTDLPKAIPTEPTECAPKGRIIDDSARGTIFWEAEREESDDESEDSLSSKDVTVDGEKNSKAWGKPFKLEWLSTTKLPFYRTRGLRNPWNSNREVKIARDGTELEPSVGRRLIGLFNRVQSPAPPMHMGMPMMAGYSSPGHLRPHYSR